MDEFYKVRIMAHGAYFDCWQRVSGGQVLEYVGSDGKQVSPQIDGTFPGLPDPHECYMLEKLPRVSPDDAAEFVWQAKSALQKVA